MIQANELRIGNWVEVENYKSIQLENIHPKGTTNGDEQYLISMLKPIPLTEEILLKCGFESTQNGDDFHAGIIWETNSDLLYCDSGFFIIKTGGYGDFADIGDVKYLHQLQNLYFALTGEELKIEL